MERPVAWQTCKSCFNNNVKHHILIPPKNNINTRIYPLCPHGACAIDDDGLRKHFTLHSTFEPQLSAVQEHERETITHTKLCLNKSNQERFKWLPREGPLLWLVAFFNWRVAFLFIIVEEYLPSYKCKSAELGPGDTILSEEFGLMFNNKE